MIVSICFLQRTFSYANMSEFEALPVVETINVRQCGAKGDNVQDDTEAFQKALNTARTVIVPDGIYKLNSQVNFIRNKQKITGVNGAKVICNSTVAIFYAENLQDIEVSSLGFESTASDITQSRAGVLDFKNCNNILVKKCNFKNIPFYYCIRFLGCNTVKAINNSIDTYLFSGIACGNGTNNAIVNLNRIVNGYGVIQGHRYPLTLSSFNGEQEIYPESNNLEAGFNYIEDFTPQWEGIDSHGGNNIWVHDNVVKGTMTGIALVDNKRTLIKKFRNALVENNRIELTTNIAPRSRTAQNSGLNIKSNNNAINIRIIGNTIKNANYNLGPTDAGIRIGGLINSVVEKNKVNAKVTGIRLVREFDDLKICNNEIYVDGTDSIKSAGIRNTAKNTINVTICDNYIDSATGYALKYGFYNEISFLNLNDINLAVIEQNNQFGNVTVKAYHANYFSLK